jgi:hypothetical protein
MIPHANIPAYDAAAIRDRTWRLHTSARIGGAEAARQAVMLILRTERCRYPIYSHGYGAELGDLIGRTAGYIKPELERRVRDALLQDDRVTGVGGFVFEQDGKGLHCTFTVKTIFGDLEGIRIEPIRTHP